MTAGRALIVSGPLSAIMHRHPKRPEAPPASPRPLFNLPQLAPAEPGDPTICVHCFLTNASHPGFSHNVRAVFKSIPDAVTGTILKTKFSFRSVTAEHLPLISRNLDRDLVGFLSGIPFIFACISHTQKNLSAIARFILETSQQSEGGQQREFDLEVPGGSRSPLTADESFDREFTQVRLKPPPPSTLYVLNLYTDTAIRQFSEVLNQLRSKTILQSDNYSFRRLFPLFQNRIQITVFLFCEIFDEFLLSAFAEKKKSVVEHHPRERDFHVNPSGLLADSPFDPTALLIERASAQFEALKKYVALQIKGLRSGAGAGAAVRRVLADLAESDHANDAARARITIMAGEVAALEEEIAAIRERRRIGGEVARLRETVREVIARTDELRGRYEAAVGEIRAEMKGIGLSGEDVAASMDRAEGEAVAEVDSAHKRVRDERRRTATPIGDGQPKTSVNNEI
jgi:hypothetical protein